MSDEATLRAQDCRARLAAQTVFDRPLVLEAGAGTGKTAALVARIVAWTVGPGWEAVEEVRSGDEDRIAADVLDGVVAITFTEDAAAEMAQRVAEMLARLESVAGSDDGSRAEEADCAATPQLLPGLFRAALPADVEQIRERARALLAQLERLRVSTIHAFARSLLARFPVEAGVHPSFEVDADGSLSEELTARAVEEVLATEYGREDGDGLALAELGIGPAQLSNAVQALVDGAVPAMALAVDPFTQEALAPLLEKLSALLESGGRSLTALADQGNGKLVKETARRLLELHADLEGEHGDALSRLAVVQRWTGSYAKNNRDKLKDWAKGKFGKKLPSSVDAGAFRPVAAELALLLDHVLKLDALTFNRLRRVLAAVLELVDVEKRRRGVVVFQDLLVLAHRLLAEHPEVCREVRLGIDQLLVDEMQDTDREQAEIVRRLSLEGPPELLPGLFLVGDPKQSIYGWRSADLAVYEELISGVLAAGGERHALVVSFRSVAAVLEEVARCVRPVMAEDPGLQPSFEPLLPCAARAADPGHVDERRRPVEHWVSVAASGDGAAARTDAATAADLEAEAVARDMAELAAAGVPRREMALLMRTRTHLESFLRALRRCGVPYEVGRDASYYRTREVIEATALLRLVLDPFDHLALATVLRSPMVGVPDAGLVPLWRVGLPRLVSQLSGSDPELIGEVGKAVAAAARDAPQMPELEALSGWPQALLTTIEAVAELRAVFRREPSDVFLELLRTSTLIEPLAAARFPGAYRIANVERFFRGLEATLGEGATPEGVLRRLRLAVRERRDEETGRPRESATDAVSVLTVHGAKGLGFRHVWLVQTHAGRVSRREPTRTAAGTVDGRWELELIGFRTPGYFGLERRQQQVAEAEEVRTLYVAMTRAKERLVTLGNWRPPRGNERSYLSLLEYRSEGWPDLDQMWEEAERSGEAWTDVFGARWVLPGHPRWAFELSAEAAPSPAPSSPSPAQISADARRLEELRGQAAARMARPWSSRASTEAHRDLAELVAAAVGGDRATAGEPTPLRPSAEAQRKAAAAVGSAVHRLLERLEPVAADPEAELQRRHREAEMWLESALADAQQVEEARERLAEVVTSFSSGLLWQRFRELAPRFVARELPVLLPPDDKGAVGYQSGVIDLVYRDPQDDRLVVVDYKTDEVGGDEQIELRATLYVGQLETYTRALREAFGLEDPPRAELWFLAADRIVPVG